MALVMAAIAGAVDSIGYLLLAHIFTSHMSGNTVGMMLHVATGNWIEAWRHFEPIVIFFGAICAGIALTDLLTAMRITRVFTVIGCLELGLLIAFLLLAHPAQQWMVVWPASAMGLQNAMLRRAGHHAVRTTFITGMITNAAQGLVEALHGLFVHSDDAQEKFLDYLFYSGIWLCFAVGGVFAAFLEVRYGLMALLLPIGGLALMIVLDLWSPVTKSPGEQASGNAAG